MPDDRYASVTQALAIYRSIRRHRRTIEEIADEHGLSAQTVRRLMAALRAGGVDITHGRRKAEGAGQPPYEYRAARLTDDAS